MSKLKVPFVNLGIQFERFQNEIVDAFVRLSTGGQYVLGQEVLEFEKRFAKVCQTKHALGVANGTDAIAIALKTCGVGPGHEVITTPNTFIGTVGAIVMVGAKPVFVDVGEDYNLNPNLLEASINNRTKAIIPIHLTGMPADMAPIMEIAKKHKLSVVEDCAQAISATYEEKPVGSIGTIGTFSLHPLKNLHLHGDGGMITTNDTQLYEKMRLYRNHGLINRDESVFFGINSRLDNIQAAIGNIKIEYLSDITDRFVSIASLYDKGLDGIVQLPLKFINRKGVYHNYIIRVQQREKLRHYLQDKGIETKVHYPNPLHLQQASCDLGYQAGDFPLSEQQAQEILSLPIYPELDNSQVSLVIDSIKDFFC